MVGTVTDRTGQTLVGYTIVLWQVDEHGNYNHPDHSAPSGLREDFQYFGTTATDENGSFVFRTQQPPAYDRRPPHLHFKVKQENATVLTSQLYFPEDREQVLRDYIYQPDGDETLFVREASDASTTELPRVVTTQIVLDRASGELAPTPHLDEGPYYPVVDFSDYDNDLLDANPYQERLTIDDVPKIMGVAPSEVGIEVAPPAGGT